MSYLSAFNKACLQLARVAGKDRRMERRESIQCGAVLSILQSCNSWQRPGNILESTVRCRTGRSVPAFTECKSAELSMHHSGCSIHAHAHCIPLHNLSGTAEL